SSFFMHKLTLLTIGKLKEAWARDAAKTYLDRLRPSFDLSVIELAPSRQPHAAGQMVEESERLLLSAQKQKGVLWVLHETGEQMTSAAFAAEIARLREVGEPIIVMLGGAYG